MNRRQKIIISVTGIFLVLLLLVGLTYGYFLTKISGNDNEKSISVTTADLKLVYNDGSDGVIGGELLIPSETEYTKTFTVKNEGNTDIDYAVYLIDVVNTFVRKDDIKYTLSCTTNGTIACNGVTTDTTFPSGINQLVTNTIEEGKTHTYTFKFTYKDTGTDQSIDMNKELNAKIQIYGKNGNNEYFQYEENTLAYNIINNAKLSTNGTTYSPNLSATNMVTNMSTASDKILATAEDDGGTTYYFRGNPTDNYVEYAGMCWRIVRIEGDGSVKLILASEKTCSSANLTTSSGYATDGAAGVQGTILKAHYGYKNSGNPTNDVVNDYINSAASTNNARTKLNAWLERKITSESDKALLKNETWCIGDLTNGYDSEGNIIGQISDLIASGTDFDYITQYRLGVTRTPSYKCVTTGVEGEVDVNKVGMLTYDERVYAGSDIFSYDFDSNDYLTNNAKTDYWLGFSVFKFIPGYAGDTYVVSNGDVDMHGFNITGTNALRPVVSLKSNTSISSGVGTISNPYIVK